jgi:hypothetical protein
MASLLVRAVDEILGTHTHRKQDGYHGQASSKVRLLLWAA